MKPVDKLGISTMPWFDGPDGRILYIGSLFDEGGAYRFVIDKPPKKDEVK